MNTIEMYDAQAGTIKVEDIVTNRINWSILRRLKSNNDDGYELCIQDDFDDEEDIYAPEGALDLGWLGYFIGKNDHLKELQLNGLEISEDIDKVTSFYRGLCNNKSINTLEFNGVNLLGGKIFSMLGPFFENNHNLTSIEIRQYDFGFEESRLLALAIGSSKNKSLRNVELSQTNISGMGMVDIITSLSVHPYLEKLELWGNRLDTKGCRALSALLQNSVTELEAINLSSNEINDEGMDILIPALKNCSHLTKLILNSTPSVTSGRWQHLATILEVPNTKLKQLNCVVNNVDDEAITAFTYALKRNNTLKKLYMFGTMTLTYGSHAWKEFSKLLCDTSSVNSTFLSNHTLEIVHTSLCERTVSSLLTLNGREDKNEVAMIKILQHHDDFDMMPFFEWDFKVLPLMINWFERASSITIPENFQPNIGPRKLSSIYQFIRGMPLMYVETRLRQELEDIKAAQIHIEEERARLDQQKLTNEERKRSILERLGRNV